MKGQAGQSLHTPDNCLDRAYWEPEFWFGYRRGLNRLRYGKIFGSDEEHHSWHDIPETLEEETSVELVVRGMGYRAGYAGLTVEEAAERAKEFIMYLEERAAQE